MRTLKNGELNSEELVLHFSGAENEVDARSLGEIIVHISSIIHRINRKIDPNSEIRIVVTSFEPGSFRAVIEFAKGNAKDILVGIIGGLIATAVWAAADYGIEVTISAVGNTEIEERQKRITMPPGFKSYIEQISSDKSIHRNIFKIADIVYNNPSVKDLSIFLSSRYSDPIVIFSESSCQKIIERYNMRAETESFPNKVEKIIQVRSADFERSDVKWKFTLDNAKISAHIHDQEFLKKVREGHISMKANERLYVEINVIEIRYKVSGDIKSKTYEVKKVLRLLDQ